MDGALLCLDALAMGRPCIVDSPRQPRESLTVLQHGRPRLLLNTTWQGARRRSTHFHHVSLTPSTITLWRLQLTPNHSLKLNTSPHLRPKT
ncbi:hypothetical protein C0J52_28340, partial [Blattella germanica]